MKAIPALIFFLGLMAGPAQAAQVDIAKHCQNTCGCIPCGCAAVRCEQQEEDYYSVTVPVPATKSTDDAVIAK